MTRIATLNEQLVTAIIVTYGDRRDLLFRVLDSLKTVGLRRAVVVNNGASWAVHSELSSSYPDLVDVVEMGKNTGSAAGYTAGIRRALEFHAEYLWLLDDDNKPSANALRELIASYCQSLRETRPDKLAALAFRPEHQVDVAQGLSDKSIGSRRNSFLGFHILDVPYKLWRRTPIGKPRPKGDIPRMVSLNHAPYSGLFFHWTLIRSIGVPNADFVLYNDDTEFTSRITRNGGRIILVTSARIDDLESSWNAHARFQNSFTGLLQGEGDFRAYYGMRNRAFIDSGNADKRSLIFWINRNTYMFVLFVFSIFSKRRRRYRLLDQALKDGLCGRLGLNKNYPL